MPASPASLSSVALLADAMGCESRHQIPPAIETPVVAEIEQPLLVKDISDVQAHTAVLAAMAEAKRIGTKMSIAVVDIGGHLKAFCRMDGAWLGSIELATKKAQTAKLFDRPSAAVESLSEPGGEIYAVDADESSLAPTPGGQLIKTSDGTIIGAIGVSGDSPYHDNVVALAGAAALA